MEDAIILSAVRTPIGRYGSLLKEVRPDDMGAPVIDEAIRRVKIDPGPTDLPKAARGDQ